METKMRISHKCLWNCIELMMHIKDSVKYLDEDVQKRKLLNFLIRLFEILEKFAKIYLDNYKLESNINRFAHDTEAELQKVCCCLLEILKIIKVRVSVMLRNNPQANDVIKSICFKAIKRFQDYLIKIDFFNKEMLRKSALNMD